MNMNLDGEVINTKVLATTPQEILWQEGNYAVIRTFNTYHNKYIYHLAIRGCLFNNYSSFDDALEEALKQIETDNFLAAASQKTKPDTTPAGGTKHDTDKLPLALLPFEALEEVAKVLDFGARKYGNHNWRSGFAWSRLISAALRHLFAFARGEDRDPETNLSHVAHAACCILFLLSHIITTTGTDDRYKGA